MLIKSEIAFLKMSVTYARAFYKEQIIKNSKEMPLTGESLRVEGHMGPLKTPLTRRKCPLLRRVELMTR